MHHFVDIYSAVRPHARCSKWISLALVLCFGRTTTESLRGVSWTVRANSLDKNRAALEQLHAVTCFAGSHQLFCKVKVTKVY